MPGIPISPSGPKSPASYVVAGLLCSGAVVRGQASRLAGFGGITSAVRPQKALGTPPRRAVDPPGTHDFIGGFLLSDIGARDG
jgi:hypothetical protein